MTLKNTFDSEKRQMLTIKPSAMGSSIISSEDEVSRVRKLDKLLLKMAEEYD